MGRPLPPPPADPWSRPPGRLFPATTDLFNTSRRVKESRVSRDLHLRVMFAVVVHQRDGITGERFAVEG